MLIGNYLSGGQPGDSWAVLCNGDGKVEEWLNVQTGTVEPFVTWSVVDGRLHPGTVMVGKGGDAAVVVEEPLGEGTKILALLVWVLFMAGWAVLTNWLLWGGWR